MSNEPIILTLRSLPSGVPVEIRLRRALKTLLRSLALRCTDVRQQGTANAFIEDATTSGRDKVPTQQTGCNRNARHSDGGKIGKMK
jgi:hypothetical protein